MCMIISEINTSLVEDIIKVEDLPDDLEVRLHEVCFIN